jgi:hypothetical protein
MSLVRSPAKSQVSETTKVGSVGLFLLNGFSPRIDERKNGMRILPRSFCFIGRSAVPASRARAQ